MATEEPNQTYPNIAPINPQIIQQQIDDIKIRNSMAKDRIISRE